MSGRESHDFSRGRDVNGSVVWGRVAAVGFGVLMFVLGAAVMALTGGGRVLRLYLGRRRL